MIQINAIQNVSEVKDSNIKKSLSTGWHAIRINEIVIVLPNHNSESVILATILHKAVVLISLRGLLVVVVNCFQFQYLSSLTTATLY